jgi:hypothetical protein
MQPLSQPLPQRHVTVVVTLVADSDERAKAIIDEALMTDGSVLDYELVSVSDVRAQEPPQ